MHHTRRRRRAARYATRAFTRRTPVLCGARKRRRSRRQALAGAFKFDAAGYLRRVPFEPADLVLDRACGFRVGIARERLFEGRAEVRRIPLPWCGETSLSLADGDGDAVRGTRIADREDDGDGRASAHGLWNRRVYLKQSRRLYLDLRTFIDSADCCCDRQIEFDAGGVDPDGAAARCRARRAVEGAVLIEHGSWSRSGGVERENSRRRGSEREVPGLRRDSIADDLERRGSGGIEIGREHRVHLRGGGIEDRCWRAIDHDL